jgi:hypothetical protein
MPVAASRQAVRVHARTLGWNAGHATPLVKRLKLERAYPHIQATALIARDPPQRSTAAPMLHSVAFEGINNFRQVACGVTDAAGNTRDFIGTPDANDR